MKILVVTLSLILCACAGSGGGGPAAVIDQNPSPSQPTGSVQSITIHTGSGFSCFTLRGRVYCSGPANEVNLGLTSSIYSVYAEDSNSDILSLVTYDNTVCWSSLVDSRPSPNEGHTPGVATYCTGVANLNGSYDVNLSVYGGPNYTTAANGSADLSYAETPMFAGDFDMTNVTGGTYIADTSVNVTVSTVSCSIDQGQTTLTCPGFVVAL